MLRSSEMRVSSWERAMEYLTADEQSYPLYRMEYESKEMTPNTHEGFPFVNLDDRFGRLFGR